MFHELTNKSYEIRIKWITKKVKQLFRLKSRNPHPDIAGRNVEL